MQILPDRIRTKPHYVFHPFRLAKRVLYRRPTTMEGTRVVSLPWGLDLEVNPMEAIGHSIATTGIFDPGVTEVLHRLVEPGDHVVDVGANVGYLTGLAATRTGREGIVSAFEPHPVLGSILTANVARWTGPHAASVEVSALGLSDRARSGWLSAGAAFHSNMGLAAIAPEDEGPDEFGVAVELSTLDDVFGEGGEIGVCKVDVEGHELAVLRGADDLLSAGRIRDLIFEEHEPYPSASTHLVEGHGYSLFGVVNDLFGVRLVPPDRRSMAPWPGPSYLATLDPARAVRLLRPRGWEIRGIGPSASSIRRLRAGDARR